MWHWSKPHDACAPWTRLVAFDLTEDIRALKQEALLRHRSQLTERGEGLGPVLRPSIVERAARHQEYFFL
jgi:hypothetical protein